MAPTCPTLADGVGGWRDPFIGPEPRPARLARVIAMRRCLITSLVALSLASGLVPLNLQALSKREAP